jgi:hypothetical protein
MEVSIMMNIVLGLLVICGVSSAMLMMLMKVTEDKPVVNNVNNTRVIIRETVKETVRVRVNEEVSYVANDMVTRTNKDNAVWIRIENKATGSIRYNRI